ncbi:GTPase activating protein (GAP) for Rho1p [Diplodia intermedia]|uniref:GTPase activating protein (GAP) for Rho1p n=1 Tax=Diplodia intermedia TaxID=856260 RepID=A0ABR3TW09_9PEZI
MPHQAQPSGSGARQWDQPQPVGSQAGDVPSKRDLTSWWRQFKRGNPKKDEDKGGFLHLWRRMRTTFVRLRIRAAAAVSRQIGRLARAVFRPLQIAFSAVTLCRELISFYYAEPEKPRGIFGVPLQDSIKYANVAISLFNEEGESYIYGYVPIVVAKCGVFLKEKAVDVEGIFRLSGSEKRIKELREAFNSPDRYGKGLDWTGYTVHDAANILRRYFNQLPEPIIPLEFYELFRDPLRNHQAQAVGPMDGQKESIGEFDMDKAIRVYQRLITELPPLNRQLLLYILDLLAVFASKSDLNKMTTANLAAIFQPGILSHPTHDMAPPEYRLSQDVLIFLIENQDNFLIGMQGTEADPKTVEEVESGPSTPSGKAPTTPTRSKTTIGRSSSNASAGAESVRKQGMIRRNVSVSSRKSKASNNIATPSPVQTQFSSGVHRSNTVPSKKSPAIAGKRFSRDHNEQSPGAPRSPAVASISIAEPAKPVEAFGPPTRPSHMITAPSSEDTTPLAPPASVTSSTGLLPHGPAPYPTSLLPHNQTPQKSRGESSDREASGFRSFSSMFQSSPHSDTEAKEKRRPNKLQKKRAPSTNPSAASSTNSLHGSHVGGPPSPLPGGVAAASANPLEPSMSPSASMRSHSTVSGGYSEAEHGDDASRAEGAEKERKHGWRLSHRKEGSKPVNENNFGSVSGAEQSMSSVSSKGGRKSLSLDPIEASSSNPAWAENREGDKKNPFDWFRGKIAERKEREEAKQRAKSPPSSIADPSSPSSERGRSVEQLPRPMQSSPPITLLEAKEEAKLVGLTPPKIESEEVTPTQTPGSASTVPSTAPLATVNAATPEVLPVEGGPVPAITMQGAPVPYIFAPAPTSPPPAVPVQAAPAQAAPANAAPVDAAPAQTAPAQTAPEEGSTVSRPQSPRQQQTVRSMLDV